uniref:F-box domain-containing protein n=1 Tax=Ditylenchus dipsaci TaxID=166011 RepID=A0A915D3E4_9BILA
MPLSVECYKDILSFVSRNDLDTISLVNRQSASVVAKYFPSNAKPSRHMHSLIVRQNPGAPYFYSDELEEPMYQIVYNKDSSSLGMQKRFYSFYDIIDLNSQQRITISTLIFKNLVCEDHIYAYIRSKFRTRDLQIIFDQMPIGMWCKNNKVYCIKFSCVRYQIPTIRGNEENISATQRIHTNISPHLRQYYPAYTDGRLINRQKMYFSVKLSYANFLCAAQTVSNGPEEPITVLITQQWEHDYDDTKHFFFRSLTLFCENFLRRRHIIRPVIFGVKDCGDVARELFASGEIYNPNTNDISRWFFLQDPPVNCSKKILEQYADLEWIFVIGQNL